MNTGSARIGLRKDLLVPALLVSASLLLVPGLFLPFFHVRSFWVFNDAVSAIGGIIALFDAGEYLLFVIIGFFTVIFPVSKIGLLALIWHKRRMEAHRLRGLQNWISHLGKWSMLDVFVVAVLIVLLRARVGMGEMSVGIGLYFFTVAIVLTQVASSMVDSVLRTDGPAARN